MSIEGQVEAGEFNGDRFFAGAFLGFFALIVDLLFVSLLNLREPSWAFAAKIFAAGIGGPFMDIPVVAQMASGGLGFTLLLAAILQAVISVGLVKPSCLTLSMAAVAVAFWVVVGVVSYTHV